MIGNSTSPARLNYFLFPYDLHVTCSIVFIALYFPLVETIPAPPLQYSFPHIPPIVEPKVTETESDRNPSTNWIEGLKPRIATWSVGNTALVQCFLITCSRKKSLNKWNIYFGIRYSNCTFPRSERGLYRCVPVAALLSIEPSFGQDFYTLGELQSTIS